MTIERIIIHDGRRYIRTSELNYVDANAVLKRRVPEIRGTELGEGMTLPVAITYKSAKSRRLDEGGRVTAGREIESFTVSNPNGWAGGTVLYPTAEGTYPAVVIIAGYMGVMQTMEWVANALASWGFVAVATEGSPTNIQPNERGVQLSAAIDQLEALNEDSSSPLFGKLNGRFGVAGHSMPSSL